MSRWSHEYLMSQCSVQDPLADETVAELFEQRGLGVIRSFHGELVDAAGQPREGLPPAMVHYLEATAAPPTFLDPRTLERAQKLMSSHGFLMLLILVCASLPEAYAGYVGAKVLFLTQKLNKDITRRVVETMRYVVDVMSPAGFAPTGPGLDASRKVRLMHAAIRYLIRHRDDEAVASELPPTIAAGLGDVDLVAGQGLPINQVEMAYALQTMGWVTVRSMRALSAGLTPEEEEAIIHAWSVSGHHLGIDERLLPDTVEAAEALFGAIKGFAAGESEEGKSLTAALLDFAERTFPLPPFRSTPLVLMHHLVDRETVEMLGVPELAPAERFQQKLWLSTLAGIIRLRETHLTRFPWLRDFSAKHFGLVRGALTRVDSQGGAEVPFEIPEALADNWALNAF